MRLKKSFQLAWNILIHSKLRSWLTIIGIIIGIAAIVSIVSISEGAQQSMEARFGDLGADVLTITPGFSKATSFTGSGRMKDPITTSDEQENLTKKDVNTLKIITNVGAVMGTVSGRGEVKYLSKTGDLSITGVDPSVWDDINSDRIEDGRTLTKSDIYSAVIGHELANGYFNRKLSINSQISIDGRIFKVVGIFAEGENDKGVIIPIDAAISTLEDIGDDSFDSISVKIKNVELIDETIEDIEKKLMLSRGILREDKKDFTVYSPKELQETISETLNTLALFLGAIAAISLLVGGIGISNTMFTAVLEKTKEIGIMKSIGAKNKDILLIFLFNSGLIGLVGGIGGVLLGAIASGAIGGMVDGGTGSGMMGRMFGSTALTPELLLFSFAFSIVVGMIAGAIPAYRASRLKPVDALRYE